MLSIQFRGVHHKYRCTSLCVWKESVCLAWETLTTCKILFSVSYTVQSWEEKRNTYIKIIIKDCAICVCWIPKHSHTHTPAVLWWLALDRAEQCCSSALSTQKHWQMETCKQSKTHTRRDEAITVDKQLALFHVINKSNIFLFFHISNMTWPGLDSVSG